MHRAQGCSRQDKPKQEQGVGLDQAKIRQTTALRPREGNPEEPPGTLDPDEVPLGERFSRTNQKPTLPAADLELHGAPSPEESRERIGLGEVG
jgi:hypothetical protein